MSTTTAQSKRHSAIAGAVLSKVPEVTIWFWIIKILCTTVGESFADWVSVDLGVGLVNTSLIFTVVLGAVLWWQLRLSRYNAFSYWVTVVVLSVTGTLYTDILTDKYHVSLAVTTPLSALALALVFGAWYKRERTLSIHSIVSLPREAFYWLAILVTFALGTAAGDWTLELTGWSPGVSVLLPTFLIVAILIGWRLGGNPVLSFWLAYVLTRPLGANLGDFLALSKAEGGVNLGTAGTSVVFLVAILATVTYLAVKRPDVSENQAKRSPVVVNAVRERRMLGYYGAIAVAAVSILAIANSRPHVHVSAEEDGSSTPVEQLSPSAAIANFPSSDVSNFLTIAQDTLSMVRAGNQDSAKSRITDLESAWDDAQSRLEPLDETAWTFLDGEIDVTLRAIRQDSPSTTDESNALSALITSLAG